MSFTQSQVQPTAYENSSPILLLWHLPLTCSLHPGLELQSRGIWLTRCSCSCYSVKCITSVSRDNIIFKGGLKKWRTFQYISIETHWEKLHVGICETYFINHSLIVNSPFFHSIHLWACELLSHFFLLTLPNLRCFIFLFNIYQGIISHNLMTMYEHILYLRQANYLLYVTLLILNHIRQIRHLLKINIL